MFLDALIDAGLDSLKLLPFLFATYLFMEWLEHGAGERFERAIAKAGKAAGMSVAEIGALQQEYKDAFQAKALDDFNK